jgi:arabinose-5-phosphate isomerase
MAEAILEMTSKGFGCVAVFEDGGRLAGILTDGDLRRHLKPDFSLDTPVGAIMTRRPRTIAPDALVAEALELISHKIQALLVVERGQVVGSRFQDRKGCRRARPGSVRGRCLRG